MKIFIKILQQKGDNILRVKFLDCAHPTVWYKAGDIVYLDLNETTMELNYEFDNTALSTDSNTLTLELYEAEYSTKFYTYTITNSSISNTTVLTCATTTIDLGSAQLYTDLISADILVTAEYLKDGFIDVSGYIDNSWWFSGNGTDYFQNKLPINNITWITSSTFNLKIKRKFDIFYGSNLTTLDFSNGTNSFTIVVTSEVKISQQLESGIIKKGSGDYSFVAINNLDNNISSGKYSVSLGNDNESTGSASFCLGDGNTASGLNAVAINKSNTASGSYSFVAGYNNTSSGFFNTSLGFTNKSTGSGTFASGRYTEANAQYSFNHSYASALTLSKTGGNASAILGGYDNTIGTNANYTGIFSGKLNTIGSYNYQSVIVGGDDNEIEVSTSTIFSDNCVILGGKTNIIETDVAHSGILVSKDSELTSGSFVSAIVGGLNHSLGTSRSVILGGTNVTSNHHDMVYVPSIKLTPHLSIASPEEGMIYFDSTSKHFLGWNGTAWKQLDN